jgi:hypothetical protein
VLATPTSRSRGRSTRTDAADAGLGTHAYTRSLRTAGDVGVEIVSPHDIAVGAFDLNRTRGFARRDVAGRRDLAVPTACERRQVLAGSRCGRL